MSHTPALSDLQAPYVAADRLSHARTTRRSRAAARHQLASRLRRTADRLDG